MEYLLTLPMESFMEMGIGFGPFLKFKLSQLESSRQGGMIDERNLGSIQAHAPQEAQNEEPCFRENRMTPAIFVIQSKIESAVSCSYFNYYSVSCGSLRKSCAVCRALTWKC